MKILIIDDDRNRSQDLKKYLSSQSNLSSCELVVAEYSDEATQLLKEVYFDVVVLDVVLPKRKDETPSAQHGLSLLERLSRGYRIKKPERIIGITCHLDDIEAFRSEFNKHCHLIIEAQVGGDSWKESVRQGLDYTFSARIDRSSVEQPITALTVHGIRTFGTWQNRLKALVCARTDSISFSTYRYGYFTLIAFSLPFLRWIQVILLKRYIKDLIGRIGSGRLVIFAHSFGTYLVANALKSLIRDGYRLPIDTVVLSGSVLNARFDWGFLLRSSEARIVNDCGDSDYVLWLSQGLVPFSGMAGKTGFFGANDSRIINRFFHGGHSLYFEGDEFMAKYWIPLFDRADDIADHDIRVPSILKHGIGDTIIQRIGMFKEATYGLLIGHILLRWLSVY